MRRIAIALLLSTTVSAGAGEPNGIACHTQRDLDAIVAEYYANGMAGAERHFRTLEATQRCWGAFLKSVLHLKVRTTTDGRPAYALRLQ